jgi:hypothetical protein
VNSDELGKLLEDIKTDLSLADPERIALVARVTADAISLQTRHLAGMDVEREAAIVQTTAMNLSEAARNVIATRVLAFSESFITKLLLGAAIS